MGGVGGGEGGMGECQVHKGKFASCWSISWSKARREHGQEESENGGEGNIRTGAWILSKVGGVRAGGMLGKEMVSQ